jgi:hypothetical protein
MSELLPVEIIKQSDFWIYAIMWLVDVFSFIIVISEIMHADVPL